jgi:hypothetical protein
LVQAATDAVRSTHHILRSRAHSPPSQHLKPSLDLQRHQLAAVFQELLVVLDLAVDHRLGDAVHLQVAEQFLAVGDAAVFLGAAADLVADLGEVGGGWPGADADVDLALRDHVVGDLVVATAGVVQAFEVLARVDVVDVGAVEQQVMDRDVARQEAAVAEFDLGGLVAQEVRALVR